MIVEILRWDKFIFFYARYHKIDNIRTTKCYHFYIQIHPPIPPKKGGKKERSSVKTTKPPPTTRRFEKKKQFERRRNPISKELECNIQSSIQRYTRRWTRERERGGEAKVEFALYFAFAPAQGETRGSSDCRYGHWYAFHGKVMAAMSLSSTSLST